MGDYILDGRTPVKVDNVREWSRWYETADRVVAKTQITKHIRVSTVFLGMDHNFGDKGPPILFETMIFRKKGGVEQERYCTWEEAEKGHAEMVKWATPWWVKLKNWLKSQ